VWLVMGAAQPPRTAVAAAAAIRQSCDCCCELALERMVSRSWRSQLCVAWRACC
jgi:hypothetical protein